MTTDPIKALVDLGPELQKRYDSRSVMNPTGSILLTYEEAPTILAAIEAMADVVMVPAKPTDAMIEAARMTLPGPVDICDADIEDIYMTMVEAAAPPASPAPVDDGERVRAAKIEAFDEALSIAEGSYSYGEQQNEIIAGIRAALAAINGEE